MGLEHDVKSHKGKSVRFPGVAGRTDMVRAKLLES